MGFGKNLIRKINFKALGLSYIVVLVLSWTVMYIPFFVFFGETLMLRLVRSVIIVGSWVLLYKIIAKKIPAKFGKEATGIPQQIRELSELKNSGVLTNEEFEIKKKELLAKM